MADHTQPGLMVGTEWWQQVLGYVVGRAADYEFAPRFDPSQMDAQYGVDEYGRTYRRGEVAGFGAMASNPMLVLGGVVLAGTFLYLLMRD